MRTLLLRALILLFFCCKNDDDSSNTDLIGTWILIEELADPGDGSGNFVPVNRDVNLTFQQNGTVIVDGGSFCNPFENTTSQQTATYDLNGEITAGCLDDSITIFYEKTGDILILRYFCIEACALKFSK